MYKIKESRERSPGQTPFSMITKITKTSKNKLWPQTKQTKIYIQSNLAIRNGLIMNKLVLRNHFLWPICHLLHKDEELLALTPNTPLIHTSFMYRKLNMDEICGLEFYLSCVHTSQKILMKSLHAQRRSFLVLNLYF